MDTMGMDVASLAAGRPQARAVQFAMGTVISHVAFGQQAQAAVAAAQAEVQRLQCLLSRFAPESEISRINRCSGRGPTQVSMDTYAVLTESVRWSAATAGRFDVTIGPLVELWQQSAAEGRAPLLADLQRALALVGYQDLILDPGDSAAGLRRAGQSLDVGAVGKGYAADRLLAIFRQHGVASGLINLGGNVVSFGTKPGGRPWRVGIRHPRCEQAIVGSVEVAGETVVTSGDYERVFVDRGGRRHHHILDPATGYPADSGLASVTIVAASSCAADALSTGVFVAGLSKGLALLRGRHGVEGVLVDVLSNVFVTRGLQDRFVAAAGVDVTAVE